MINERYVKSFCRDDISKIENYDKAIADKSHTWHCHHRREIQPFDNRIPKEYLIKIGEYYDRPAEELIFLTYEEHVRLHHKGKKFSEETRAKMRVSHKGHKHSAETCAKISASHQGKKHSDAVKAKMSVSHKGKHWHIENLK